MNLSDKIRSIPDFPDKGVLYRDITPLIQDKDALKSAVNQLAVVASQWDFDYICGPESRGYIFGVPLAVQMHKGFIPVRKEGKLPFDKITESYTLEYGEAVIEMHVDAIKPGDKVLLIDDLLATGGTSRAMADLVERLGGHVVACIYVIELLGLHGRDKLKAFPVHSLIQYE